MAILFRCPCGRSMVVESDRAGAQVMCPNCRRTLKVPTGKDRGVELASVPAATKTRTSRLCPRCRKEVPVDSQTCPHCKTPMGQGAAAAPPAPAAPPAHARDALADAVRSASGPAPRAAAAARPSATADAGEEEHVIIYGGSRASWFTQLSTGAKVGAIGGAAAFVLVLAIISYFLYASWRADQVVEGRNLALRCQTEGRKLENQGKFQEAYELCYSALNLVPFLRSTGQPADIAAADSVQTRINALHYLVADPKVHIGESVYWKPKNQAELDQARAHLRETYPTYRNAVLAWCDAAAAAIQTGRTSPNQAAFEDKVALMMDAYVKFSGQIDERQRAQYTFQTLLEVIRTVAGANRNWNKPDRNQYMANAVGYLDALRERASTPGYPDAVWER